MKRAIEGREQNEALKAAKDDRCGVIKQTKTGHQQSVHHDVGLMTVSQQGKKSKFKSCFGEAKVYKKKEYVPDSSANQRRKPVSYFDTVKRMESQ